MKNNVLKLALMGLAIGSFVGGCACGSNGDNYQNKQNNQNRDNSPCNGGSSNKRS